MKRSELFVGQEVEVQRGESYKTFTRAIVVDTEPWTEARSSWRSTASFGTGRYYRASEHTTSRNGVALAVPDVWYHSNSNTRVAGWKPAIAQLRQLKPVGTAIKHAEAEQKERDRRSAAQKEREQTEEKLRQRVGVESEWDLRFRYVFNQRHGGGYYDTGTVEIKTTVLEKLLDELEGYQANLDQ